MTFSPAYCYFRPDSVLEVQHFTLHISSTWIPSPIYQDMINIIVCLPISNSPGMRIKIRSSTLSSCVIWWMVPNSPLTHQAPLGQRHSITSHIVKLSQLACGVNTPLTHQAPLVQRHSTTSQKTSATPLWESEIPQPRLIDECSVWEHWMWCMVNTIFKPSLLSIYAKKIESNHEISCKAHKTQISTIKVIHIFWRNWILVIKQTQNVSKDK